MKVNEEPFHQIDLGAHIAVLGRAHQLRLQPRIGTHAAACDLLAEVLAQRLFRDRRLDPVPRNLVLRHHQTRQPLDERTFFIGRHKLDPVASLAWHLPHLMPPYARAG